MMLIRRELLGAAGASGPSDPYFENVTLLLHGDGTNGGQNNTFVATNNAAVNVPGGYGAYFDGNGDYLSVASNAAFGMGTGDFTLECWVFLNAYNGTGSVLIDLRSGVEPSVKPDVEFSSSGVLSYRVNGASQITGGTLALNTWYHIALARSGTTTKMFINGTQTGSNYTDTNNYGTTSACRMGADDDGSPNAYLNGYMSNLRIVKGTALYTANFTPPSAPLSAVSGTSLLTCQSATFIDNSSNNFTITVTGNTAITSPSNSGLPITRNGNTTQGSLSPYGNLWSNYFDGTGDYLSIPASSQFLPGANTDFTCEAWVNMSAAPSAQGARIVGTGEYGTNADWALGITSASLPYFYINVVGGYFLTSSTAISVGTWNHIAVSRSGTSTNNLKMFLNGVLVAQATQNVTLDYNGNNLTIGADANGDEENYTGYISNVRFINGSGIYTAAFTPSTTPLTAITNTVLLTCQSNRFIDNSSNNFTITRNGDVSVQRLSPFAPTTAYDAATLGGSGYFDGTGDYLGIASTNIIDFGTGDFEISYWYYPTVAATTTAIQVHIGNSVSSSTCSCGIGGSTIGAIYFTTSTVGYQTTAVAQPRAWNFITWSRVSGTLRGFLNGVQVLSTAFTTSLSATSCGIGASYSGSDAVKSAYISNIRLVKGSGVTSVSVPTTPLTAITNTSLLLNFTNASIFDNAMMADLETVGNAQIDTAVKKFGTGSLEFDGAGDGLLCLTSPQFVYGSGDFTIECWLYLNTTGTFGIFGHGDGTSTNLYFYINTSTPTVFFNNTGIATGPSISTGSWTHLAITRSGTTLRVFTNGVSGTSVTNSTTLTAGGPITVGMSSSQAQVLNGYIDDLRITKGVARYTSNFTPPTAAFPNK